MKRDIRNDKRLAALKQWLDGQNIDYVEWMVDDTGLRIDLYLPVQNIAVHVADGHSQHFYEKARGEYKPLFIRYNDTAEFVIEKMQNCMAGYLRRTAPKSEKPAKTEHHEKEDPRPQIKKRQRVRVSAQRVIPPKK